MSDDEPIVRPTARVVLISGGNRVLLFLHVAEGLPQLWVPPGGGIEDGEAPSDAAVREVWEETGAHVEVEGPIWHRRVVFPFKGRRYDTHETYFVARVDDFMISRAEHTELEECLASLSEADLQRTALLPDPQIEHLNRLGIPATKTIDGWLRLAAWHSADHAQQISRAGD